jgi:hypothetical protein
MPKSRINECPICHIIYWNKTSLNKHYNRVHEKTRQTLLIGDEDEVL